MTAIYDEIGHGYAGVRRPDARITARVTGAVDATMAIITIQHWPDRFSGSVRCAESRAARCLC